MYSDYLKEIHGRDTLEHEQGFATYEMTRDAEGNKYCYICDIYVIPEARKSNFAKDLSDEIGEIAKEAECKYLVGTVAPTYPNSQISLKVLLGCGFTLQASQENFILFKKEL